MKEIYIVTNGSDSADYYNGNNTPDRAFTTYKEANVYAYSTIKELYDSTIQEEEEEKKWENTLLISPKILETNIRADKVDYVKEYTFTTSDKYEHVKVTTTYYVRIYKVNLYDE